MTSKPFSPAFTSGFKLQLVAPVTASLSGCMHLSPTILPDRPQSKATEPAAASPPAEPASGAASASTPSAPTKVVTSGQRLFRTPSTPTPTRSATSSNASNTPANQAEVESTIALEQMPLPNFIETVFATILKRNISVDPAIAQRKDLVSLKTGKPLTATALFETSKAVLKSYGVAVTEYEGLVRITAATGSSGYLPELLRGRALPDVPASLRPIFFLVDMQSVSPGNVTTWLRSLFGNRIGVQDDLGRQAVLLSGQSDDVAAALEALEVLDQPMMRGRISARVAPIYWSADELAKRLSEVLTAQGYNVGTNAAVQAPIILLPIGPLNSVIVFAASDSVLNHVLRWATELDQPASGRGTAGYFTYPVKNIDAAELAKTLQEVMNPAAGGPPTAGAVRSRVVVNAATNTLIIQGNPTEYQQWFGLLQELDRPALTALVSVTIAEVRLSNTEAMGFDWLLKQFSVGGYNVNVKNITGQQDKGNFVAAITSKTNASNALLNALASNNKARILANPSVMARNGEQASIQVGQDVPIITQQQQSVGTTSPVPGGVAQASVLQTIQYRNTGVILKVKPVIHSGGRIDIDIEQEVSTVLKTTIGVTSTPTFQNRRISTKLSVSDGTTVLLGGLMEEQNKLDDSGVPWFKDIPVAGHLFKNSTDTRDRTELVVLVTPYVIANEFEARSISEAFRNQFRWDSSTPTQSLRPPKPKAADGLPEGQKDSEKAQQSGSIPYVLPPAGHNSEPERSSVPPSSNINVGRKQQTPRDFPSGEPKSNPGSNASTNVGSSGVSGTASKANKSDERGGVGVGRPVEDPQLIKELTDALNRKR